MPTTRQDSPRPARAISETWTEAPQRSRAIAPRIPGVAYSTTLNVRRPESDATVSAPWLFIDRVTRQVVRTADGGFGGVKPPY